jgi:hypothetical protein
MKKRQAESDGFERRGEEARAGFFFYFNFKTWCFRFLFLLILI